jgi:hypothetical protein
MKQEKIKIAGKETSARIKTETIEVGDVEGHYLMLIQAEGVFQGKPDLLDGAQEIAVGTYDLVNGNGPFHGYVKATKDGDSVYAKFEGTLTTSPSANGTPVVTSKNTWSYIKGTGRFENIQGSGTAKGKAISSFISIFETEGELFFKK